ncbi:MAG TPA: CHAT domain-containing protein, partial [Vicinamibacteria bacterium]
REGSWDRQLLAFGDPLMPLAAASALLARARAGSDLEFARPEVVRIAALFEDSPDLAAVEAGTLDRFDGRCVSLRLGAEATKEAVESLFDPAAGRGSVRFVHFATHGWADTGRPQFSWLLLAPGPSGDPFWRTLEIFNARIPAELVVLSACESGLGRIVQGEGLLGLARAFFYAGATSLCASLWSVNDEATAGMMASFYRHLLAEQRDGGGSPLAKAEALRRAQLDLLETGGAAAHPSFWSPFVLLGDWS